MSDPAYDLQAAVYAVLTTLGAAPVYSRIPAPTTDASFPLLYIGDDQIIADQYEQATTCEAHVNVHVFSRGKGKAEIKGLVRQIIPVLESNIAINNFVVLTYDRANTRYMTEADGLTEHAVVELSYVLMPALPAVTESGQMLDMSDPANSQYVTIL